MRRLDPQFLENLGLTTVNYYELQYTYAGFNLPTKEDWASGIPAVETLLEAQQVLSNGILQAKTMQSSLGSLAAGVGVPSAIFDKVQAVIGQDIAGMLEDALQQVLNKTLDAVRAVVEEALATAMEGLNVVMNLVTSIPLYGYLIELVWNLVKGLIGLVQILKAQKKAAKLALVVEQGFPAYSPDVDLGMFNNIGTTIRETLDWTSIWTPPYMGISQVNPGTTFGVGDIEGDNWVIQGIWDTATGSPGCTPGVGWTVQGVLISDLPLEGIRMLDTGEIVFPSVRQQNGYLWKSLSQSNEQPGIYCIRADILQSQWAEYVGRFWHYVANAGFKSSWMEKLQLQYGGTYQEPGPFFGLNFYDKNPPDAVVENVLCVHECNLLRQRQEALLNTPLIAYLRPDMVALKDNTQLRTTWYDRRKQLLSHAARCSLDLATIETLDPVYHQALIESGAGSVGCGPTGLTGLPTFDSPNGNIPKGFPGLGGVSQEPSPPSPPHRPPYVQSSDGTPWYATPAAIAGGVVLTTAAAAAIAYIARK